MLSKLTQKQDFNITCFLSFDQQLNQVKQIRKYAKQILTDIINSFTQLQVLQLSNNRKLFCYQRAINSCLQYRANRIGQFEAKFIEPFSQIIQNMSKIVKNLDAIKKTLDESKQENFQELQKKDQKAYKYCQTFFQLYQLMIILYKQYMQQHKLITDKYQSIGSKIFLPKIQQKVIDQLTKLMLHISFETYVTKTAYWQQLLGKLERNQKI